MGLKLTIRKAKFISEKLMLARRLGKTTGYTLYEVLSMALDGLNYDLEAGLIQDELAEATREFKYYDPEQLPF